MALLIYRLPLSINHFCVSTFWNGLCLLLVIAAKNYPNWILLVRYSLDYGLVVEVMRVS